MITDAHVAGFDRRAFGESARAARVTDGRTLEEVARSADLPAYRLLQIEDGDGPPLRGAEVEALVDQLPLLRDIWTQFWRARRA